MKVRTNAIINNIYAASWQSKVLLVDSQCRSMYGCPMKDLADPVLDELSTTWRVCCKLSGLPRRRSEFLPSMNSSLRRASYLLFTMGYTHPVVKNAIFQK